MSIVTDIFLPIALAFIMFALGLGLTGADFLRVIKQPKDFFVLLLKKRELLLLLLYTNHHNLCFSLLAFLYLLI